MPVMDRDRWRVLAPLLDQALELSQPERSSWLETLRSSDPSLAAELTSLLSSDSAADEDDFLTVPPPRPPEGLDLGPWTLERQIGQGGMGSVWLARRTDGRFEGRAAVKFLNLARLGPRGETRFRREGSLLARLSHAGIARLLDAGVAVAGQSYLVLEYVEGKPIDTYADERCLTVADRIRLVQQVLSAVSHAHGNLIVHRDLKPSNIFVTLDGTVKLLDFGIAKLLDAQGADEGAVLTGDGRALTPQYAAPEQVRGATITTATDVYAVGVLLYVLLTGCHPYDLAGRTPAEIERIVCDVEPPRPSTRFASGDNDGQDARTRAAARGATPERLTRRLQGDLDAIVMKALSKEASQRFGSAHAFADDLQRHLSGHAVLARPQRSAYRARRFIGRHRLGVATAAGVALLIAGYAATVTYQRAQIRVALAESQLSTRRAEEVTDFMMGLFAAAEEGKALTDSVTARALLSRGEAQARQLGQSALRAQMLDVIGRLYMQLGEFARARPLVKEALEIRRALYGEEHADVATSLESVADVAAQTRDVAEVIALRREALELRRRLAGPKDQKSIDVLYGLAHALHRAGQDSAAWPLFQEWGTIIARQPREVTPIRADQLELAAELAEWRGYPERAESLYTEELAIRREVFGASHPLVANTLESIGGLRHRNGRSAEAEPILREAIALLRESYPDGHPSLAIPLRGWAFVLQRTSGFPASIAPLREALALRRRFLGEHAIDVAVSDLDLANALTATRSYIEAERLAREAAAIFRREFGANNGMVIFAMVHVGDALRGQGRFAEAEPLLLAGYERFKVPKPSNFTWRSTALGALARFHDAQGHPEEAQRLRDLISQPKAADGKTNGSRLH